MNWSELAKHSIKVFHTPWCPDCHRLDKIFADNGISYTEVDIDADPTAADYVVKNTGHRAIPYVEIDGKCIVRGWHKEAPGRWNEAIFFQEVEAKLK